MRSSLTFFLSALALCLTVAAPAHATTVVPVDPTGSLFDLYFDAYDADLPTPLQDNTHLGSGLEFWPPPLGTDDLLYDSVGGSEGVDGYSLVLDETFTPDGFGGGVMHFNIDNRNYSGQPMFPGVSSSVDSAVLDIYFYDFTAQVLDVTYTVDGFEGFDAMPATIWGNAPVEVSLDWLGTTELASAESIQVDVTIAPVPEPTSLALVGSLVAGLFGLRRRFLV